MPETMSPREKVELKPCPFCGGEAMFENEHPEYQGRMFVGCKDCCAEGEPLSRHQYTVEEQVAVWNRRAALASSGDHAELIERVREVANDCHDAKDGGIILGGSVAREHGADLEAFIAEVAALRASASVIEPELGDLEATNADLSAHLSEAERKLAEAVGLLRDALEPYEHISDTRAFEVMAHGPATRLVAIRTFLSKEAERG